MEDGFREKVVAVKKELNRAVIGREDVIHALLTAIVSGEHILILGKHGEAKSYLVNKLAKVTALRTFYRQLHNETTLKEVVGMLNPIEYQKGNLDLLKTDFWDSNILYFDEFLRGKTEFLDFLLEVMIERRCSKTILGDVGLPVVTVIATSNPLTEEYNTERLDLALKDRFAFIVNVNHLIEESPELLGRVIDSSDDELQIVALDVDEMQRFRENAMKSVEYDTSFIEEMFKKFAENGFVFSTRFIKKYRMVCQVGAFLENRTKCNEDDYLTVGYLMLKNRYETLGKEQIDAVLDETLILVNNKELMDEIRNAEAIGDIDDFIIESANILNKTNENYSEYPKRLQELVDNLRKKMVDSMNSNIRAINPAVLAKLDSEEFKPIIERFLMAKGLETRYVEVAKVQRIRSLVAKNGKSCRIEEQLAEGYVKFRIFPVLSSPKSFKEIEVLATLFEERGLFSTKSPRWSK